MCGTILKHTHTYTHFYAYLSLWRKRKQGLPLAMSQILWSSIKITIEAHLEYRILKPAKVCLVGYRQKSACSKNKNACILTCKKICRLTIWPIETALGLTARLAWFDICRGSVLLGANNNQRLFPYSLSPRMGECFSGSSGLWSHLPFFYI